MLKLITFFTKKKSRFQGKILYYKLNRPKGQKQLTRERNMNKKMIALSAIAVLASASFGIETWYGDAGEYKVTTGFGDGSESDESGYWYNYADDADGGASKVTWPVAIGNDYSDDALDPVIDHCKGVCGTFTLSKGTLTYKPFVGIGFNLVDGSQSPADASAWGGVCITYTVDAQATLEMGLGDAGDAEIGFDNPFVTLPKSSTASTLNKAWSDFKQVGWGTGKITGSEAAAKLAAIKFKIQAADGTTGNFNIMSIGAYNGGCKASDGSAIAPAAAISSVKATLSGRTLALSGIKSAASVEVMNLQGQVVKKAVVNGAASMDLSKLNNGVYMVRIAGKTVNMNQKIILK